MPICVSFATRPIVWDDEEQELGDLLAVIVRSCWDYQLNPEQFLVWAERVRSSGVQLFNPLPTLRWNHDKRYLRELGSLGAAVPEAVGYPHAVNPDRELRKVAQARGWPVLAFAE